ncbi:hypothetical protein [Alteromonas sp. 14N.309.X.WAT.G.H12]|uniref:hypothetical protein n=1 Tax=Alteromonas sp. 14N.309.X.WAT.G.H12 TaxID=3120824 RepID=UPI002FD69B1D
MTFRYPTTHSSPFFGVPLLYLSVCFLVNYFTGVLDYESITGQRSQRDFNTAIGLPLFTTFFWITLRVQQQHVARIIMRYLTDNNVLSHFSMHRRRLAEKLIVHTYVAAIAGIFVTLVYIISEDLLVSGLSVKMAALYVMAFSFWFFFWLFMFQSLSTTHYLISHFTRPRATTSRELVGIRRVLILATENILFVLAAMAISPVFWFNISVPAIDACTLTFFASVMLIYLAYPVFKLHRAIRKRKEEILNSLIDALRFKYGTCSDAHGAKRLEITELEREIEAVEAVTPTYWGSFQFSKVMGVILLVPGSWLLIHHLQLLVFH